jgi:hypothetical protein
LSSSRDVNQRVSMRSSSITCCWPSVNSVAIKFGELLPLPRAITRFLAQLALGRVQHRLAFIHAARRQLPQILPRR